MNRRAIVLDIETMADEAYTSRPEFREQLRASIEAPSNYKDPVKIAAYCDEQLDKALKQFALSPMTGRVVCVGMGWLDDEQEPMTFASDDEAEVLAWLMRTLPENPAAIAGFNVRKFDIPFLTARASLHGLELAPWWPHARDYRRIADLRDVLEEGRLAKWLDRFGLPPKTADGSEVEGMTLEEIAAYCENDVRVERELVRRCAWALPAIRELRTEVYT